MPNTLTAAPRPQKNTFGGWNSFTSWSSGLAAAGSNLAAVSGPGDFLLQSGPGRLDFVFINPSQALGGTHNLNSGGGVIFYDSAVATSGGPFVLSGHKVVYTTPPPQVFEIISGQGQNTALGNPMLVSIPFQSGLVIRLQSGQPGFTANWSPEPSSVF